MRDTFQTRQRRMITTGEDEDPENGGVYGLRPPHGFAVNPIRVMSNNEHHEDFDIRIDEDTGFTIPERVFI